MTPPKVSRAEGEPRSRTEQPNGGGELGQFAAAAPGR